MADVPYDALIDEAATTYGVRPELARAMFKQESNFDPNAVSKKGAQGVGQLMPATQKEMGVTNPLDPRQSIFGGVGYLRQQLDRFGGDERLALAAYNAGPGAVQKAGGVPPFPETQDYVARILGKAGSPRAPAPPAAAPTLPEGASPTGGPPTDVPREAYQIPTYDLASGKRVEIPHDLIPQEVMAGRVGFLRGSTVPVVHPNGQLGDVPAEDAVEAFHSGFRAPTTQELYNSALQKMHGGGLEMAKTFLESGLSSATFGAAPWLERGLGISTPEAMAGRAEANPGTEIAGGVAGVAGSMLLPGPNLVKGLGRLGEGAALLATGAERAAPAVRAAAAAAEAAPEAGYVERLYRVAAGLPERVGTALGRTAKTLKNVEWRELPSTAAKAIVEKGVQRGIQGGVEGAIYAGGHEFNQAALNDPNLSAESVLANIGAMSALGGGIGAAIGPIMPRVGRAKLPVEPGTPGIARAAWDIGPLAAGVSGVLSPIEVAMGFPMIRGIAETGLAIAEKTGSFVNHVRNQVASGVTSIVKGSQLGTGIPVVAQEEGHLEKLREEFQDRIEKVQKLASSPELLQRTMEAQTNHFAQFLPKVADGTHIASARAVSFLAEKVPRAPSAGPLAQKWAPSMSEIATFNRYWNAVEKPTGILKDAAQGSLTPEAIEAVHTVYPALYAQITKQLLDKITDQKEPLPYRTRLMTAMLLGQDVDGSTAPVFVARNQSIFHPPPPPAPAPAPRVKARKGMSASKLNSKNTLSSRTMTSTQRSAYSQD